MSPGPSPSLKPVPAAFKSAYLIHGDDHGRIAERRSRLRALAESQSGTSGVEVFEGDTISGCGRRRAHCP